MSKDKFRIFPDSKSTLEPPDVVHLEAWAARLGAWLEGKGPPTSHYSFIFRPDIGAEKALMRLEENHPALVRQIVRMVGFCEADLRALEQGRGHVDDLASSMTDLFFTLNNAIDAIKNLPKTDGKKNTLTINRNDNRDNWIYNEAMKGTEWDSIIRKQRKKPEKWERINSVQGIKDAAKRYARRHDLPQPPSRQAGRQPKRKS